MGASQSVGCAAAMLLLPLLIVRGVPALMPALALIGTGGVIEAFRVGDRIRVENGVLVANP